MIRTWLKRSAFVIAALLAVIVVSLYLIVATEAGTRWMFARAEAFLPPQMQIDGIGGSLLSGLSVNELSWRDEQVDVTVANIETNIAFRPLLQKHVLVQTLNVQSVAVVTRPGTDDAPDGEPIVIEIPLKISLVSAVLRDIMLTTEGRTSQIDSITLSGEAAGHSVRLNEFSVASEWLSLSGEIGAELASPYEVDANLIWALEEVVTDPLAGALSIAGDTNAYRINHELDRPQPVISTGTVRIVAGNLQFDLDNRWSALDWPIDETQSLTSSGGALRLSGDFDDYQVVASTSIEMDPWPIADLEIDGRGNLRRFDLTQLQLSSELGNANATGNVDWSTNPTWMFDYRVSDLQTARIRSEVDGIVNAEGTISGNIGADNQPAADIRIARLSGTLNEQPLEGEIAVAVQNGAVDLADSWLAVNQNRIDARGRMLPELDVALEWEVQDFREILTVAGGRSQGSIDVRRNPSAWELNTDLAASDLQWQNYSVGSLNIEGNFSTTGDMVGTLDGDSIQVNEQTIESLDINASGSVEQHIVELALQADDRTLQIHAGGSYSDQQWVGDIDSFRLVDGERTTWESERIANVTAGSDTLELDLCLQETGSTGRVCADASMQPEIAQLNVTVEKVPLSLLAINSTATEIDFEGSIGGELVFAWEDQKLNGTAAMQLDQAAVKATFEGEEIVATVESGVANATITDNNLSATADLQLAEYGFSRAEVSIDDITDPRSRLRSFATVELTDISFAPLVLPAVSEVSGTVRGELNVSGLLMEPELGGNLRLDNGAFRANNAGVSVTDVDLELRQADSGQLSLNGSAQSGGGQILVTGTSRIDPALGLQTALTISGEDFEFVRLPEWQAIASPDIQINVDNESAIVRGSISVPRAQVTLQSLPETAERVSPDATIYGREEEATATARRIDLDIETTLGEHVALSGFGLETNLMGALRLTGGSGEPLIGIGRIDLRDGRYEAYGQELEIENGALIFSGPLTNPTLDIRATREVSDVTAGLQLSGTPNDIRSTVFSEPALSDAEALSYLIAGRPLAAADDEESNRVGQAAFALGLTGADKVIAQVQSKLGLDSLTLDSSDDVGRIVAGRRIGGRLLVEYGYGLVDRLGTLLLRYQLNDRVIVETTTGTASTLDVVYSVKKN